MIVPPLSVDEINRALLHVERVLVQHILAWAYNYTPEAPEKYGQISSLQADLDALSWRRQKMIEKKART